MAEDDQFGRPAADDLAAQLGADGAARAGHQHAPAADQRGDLLRVGMHRLAAQQVFDLHVAQLADAGRAAQQLIHAGDDAGAHAGLLADVHDLADGRTRGAGHGDDDLVDLIVAHQPGMASRLPNTRTRWISMPCL